MRRPIILRLGALILGTMLFSPLPAQVYEWVDDDGNRHFSDKEPDGVVYRVLGDPAENLSSYAATAVRRPRPDTNDDDKTSSQRAQTRRSPEETADDELEAACADYLDQIDAIHDQLRTGYREPTGNRLRAERSALRAAYQRECT